MLLRVSVNFGPIAPLRFRRWLRVKVSGQGPPKPSPAAEAQRCAGQCHHPGRPLMQPRTAYGPMAALVEVSSLAARVAIHGVHQCSHGRLPAHWANKWWTLFPSRDIIIRRSRH